jgi:putative phage-type endonuclease
MDRAQWLEERRSGIGGSDVAPMLGLSPWKTPFALWQDKTGRAVEVEPDEAQRERMHFGTVLEDVVAREHAARTGQRVQRVTSMLRHPDVPIALANLDRAIVEDGSRARWDQAAGRVLGARGILECKTAHALAQNSADWGEPGTDQVPAYYWMQVHTRQNHYKKREAEEAYFRPVKEIRPKCHERTDRDMHKFASDLPVQPMLSPTPFAKK